MAKVTGALMSIEASGQFAKNIVFDRRGFARGYTIPSNPRTSSQQATRLAMKAAQYAAKHLNTTARTALTSKLGYRWNAALLSETLGTNLANWNTAMVEYETLAPGDMGALQTLAATLKLSNIQVPEYDELIAHEAALYAVLCGYNRLTAPAAPVAVANISTLFA